MYNYWQDNIFRCVSNRFITIERSSTLQNWSLSLAIDAWQLMYQGVISLHASYLINKRFVHFVTMKQNPIVFCSYIVWSHGNYGVDLWIGLGSNGACQIQLIMSCCNEIFWWQGVFSDEQFYRCIMEFLGWSGWLEIT